MLELKNNTLSFHFRDPPEARVSVVFNRLSRIPDDADLPASSRTRVFPRQACNDYRDKSQPNGAARRRHVAHVAVRAMCCSSFRTRRTAICTLGRLPSKSRLASDLRDRKPWSKLLREGDYCIVPEQPWLGGYVVENGVIRQFVAAPLGMA
jgi:hypothetical protein